MIEIRKTYMEVNPELLFAEIRDFTLKQEVTLTESKLETYTMPDESAAFTSHRNVKPLEARRRYTNFGQTANPG